MALKNASNNYLIIVEVKQYSSVVITHTFKDESTREAQTDFDAVLHQSFHCGELATEMVGLETTGNVQDDLKKAAYLALKNEPPFNGASGETWSDC